MVRQTHTQTNATHARACAVSVPHPLAAVVRKKTWSVQTHVVENPVCNPASMCVYVCVSVCVSVCVCVCGCLHLPGCLPHARKQTRTRTRTRSLSRLLYPLTLTCAVFSSGGSCQVNGSLQHRQRARKCVCGGGGKQVSSSTHACSSNPLPHLLS